MNNDTLTITHKTTIEEVRAFMRRMLNGNMPKEYIDLACERVDMELVNGYREISQHNIIVRSFLWEYTPEGSDFWDAVDDALRASVFDIDVVSPPLPTIPNAKPAMSEYETKLRDEFAKAALIGNMANTEGWTFKDDEALAKSSYAIADAMMKARKEASK